jgi:hypothetical protein
LAPDGRGLQIWQSQGHWSRQLVDSLPRETEQDLEGRPRSQSGGATPFPASAQAPGVLCKA